MERFSKLAIPIMALLVAWSEPQPCHAQTPSSAPRGSTGGSIPPPRPFAEARPGAVAMSAAAPAQPAASMPAAAPAGGQRGANIPAPLPATADPSAPARAWTRPSS